MTLKSATITTLLGEAGLDDAWAREAIRKGYFRPLTSTANRKRLLWSFNDGVRLSLLMRLIANGLPPKVGGAIGHLPLGQGLLFALVCNDDGSFRGRAVDPEDVPDVLDDNPSALSIVVVNVDDVAAVVGIVDKAAHPDEVDA